MGHKKDTTREKPNLMSGFGILEIVVAITVIGTALFAIMTVARTSLELNRRVLLSTKGGFLLEESSEGIRMIRDSNWSDVSGLTVDTPYHLVFENNKWMATTTETMIDDIFSRTVTASSVYRDDNYRISDSGTLDPDTRKFTVNVSWWNGVATTTRTMVFYLANIFN